MQHRRNALSAALVSTLLVHTAIQGQGVGTVLEGPHLGQPPPGSTATIFAPGVVSTDLYELFGALTPEMDEFYFVRYDAQNKPKMIVFKLQDGRWRESVVGPRVGEPSIAPDGRTMHLGRRYMERTDDGWSEIRGLGPPFDDMRIMFLTASSDGTYYFDEFTEDGSGAIRSSRLIDEARQAPQLLGEEINGGKNSAHPFIAPDQSYLLFDSKRDDGFGSSDLYVSFRQDDGSWSKAVNLGGQINTEAWEASAQVTPDGRYLFFNRAQVTRNSGARDTYSNSDIYWVDARVIRSLKPVEKSSTRN